METGVKNEVFDVIAMYPRFTNKYFFQRERKTLAEYRFLCPDDGHDDIQITFGRNCV